MVHFSPICIWWLTLVSCEYWTLFLTGDPIWLFLMEHSQFGTPELDHFQLMHCCFELRLPSPSPPSFCTMESMWEVLIWQPISVRLGATKQWGSGSARGSQQGCLVLEPLWDVCSAPEILMVKWQTGAAELIGVHRYCRQQDNYLRTVPNHPN